MWIKTVTAVSRLRPGIRLGRGAVPNYRSRAWTVGHRMGSKPYCIEVRPQGRGSGGSRTWCGGSFVQETGLRNSACGADKFGFKDLAAVHWNHTAPTLYEHADRQQGRRHRRGRRALRRDRRPYRPQPEGQAHRRRCADREHRLVGRQPQDDAGELRPAARRLHRPRPRQDALRAGPLRRRRSEIPDQDARLHRVCLALAVHPPVADPPRALRARSTSSPSSPSSTCRASRPIPSATAAAPTPSSPSTSPRRSS